ncbi:NlpC/P60 family protein [Tenacibaculum sp. MAR_2009_124]|uniref:C40 family peptidase n=1 Tax=Tenacibaculum sp. MAR_2009_124 TaxID=1250059 RepID=UPI000895B2AC|nr:C40 family peptidase [Tenacibaculum sp. MAR_2009_124]SEB94596.1 NlpC/P60 family protein [Tenacibaculum sp. MAR_2009_124]
MKQQLFLFIGLLSFITYCYIKTNSTPQNDKTIKTSKLSKSDKVISIANSYLNTPYRGGGTTKSGMDCSGLVQTSFKEIDIKLPRSSSDMSDFGKEVSWKDIKPGDLLFFNIDRLQGSINHVGLVTEIKKPDIYFIHSTTKKGVIINSLQENYWASSFAKAKRVIE